MIEPLTDLVAGPARHSGGQSQGDDGRRQAGRLAGDAGRSRRRPDHRRRSASAVTRRSRSISEERVDRATAPIAASFFMSIRSTAPRNSLPAATTSRSIIALVTDGRPLLGVVGAPALGLLWRGLVGPRREAAVAGRGIRSTRRPIRTRACLAGQPGSRRSAARISTAGPKRSSSSEAAARMPTRLGAEVLPGRGGSADIYPRLSADLEWDIAAGHAIVDRGRRQRHRQPRQPSLRFGERRGLSWCRNSSPGAIRAAAPLSLK